MQMQQKADFDQIIIVRPKLLKQTNDDDCGLFVLEDIWLRGLLQPAGLLEQSG